MLDFEASWLDLLLVSASFKGRHGDRLKEAHKRQVARTVARAEPKVKHTEETIAATPG